MKNIIFTYSHKQYINLYGFMHKIIYICFFTFQPEEIVNRLQNYRKFLIVRDPLERFVSAFHNKLVDENWSAPYFKNLYGKVIQKKYRSNETLVSKVGEGTTFEEFVRYVIATSKTDAKNLNEHWASESQLCHPCLVR